MIGPIDTFNPGVPFEFFGVCYDPQRGAGAMECTNNVNYMGFVIFVRPSSFLRWARRLRSQEQRSSRRHFQESLVGGDWCIAPPCLYLEWGESIETWNAVGHEGRHRSRALMNLRVPWMPVCVKPKFERARNMDEDRIESLVYDGIIPEGYSASSVRFSVMAVVLNKKVYVAEEDLSEEMWLENGPDYIRTVERQSSPQGGWKHYWSQRRR